MGVDGCGGIFYPPSFTETDAPRDKPRYSRDSTLAGALEEREVHRVHEGHLGKILGQLEAAPVKGRSQRVGGVVGNNHQSLSLALTSTDGAEL